MPSSRSISPFPLLGLALVVAMGVYLRPHDTLLLGTLLAAYAAALLNAYAPSPLRPHWLVAMAWTIVLGHLGLRVGLLCIGLGVAGATAVTLPLPAVHRGALLFGGLAVLGMARSVEDFSPILHTVVPVLGSWFMFRGWLFLRQAKQRKFSEALAYFFLFPNAFYLLFPVIDFNRFQKTLTAPAHRATFDCGVHSIVRGLIQLWAYQLFYLYWVPSHTETGWDAVRLLTVAFPLYLQLSGQFHLIVGALGVAGIGLPPTHFNFFLARGLVDFWKRINIYWKDFLSSQIYFPAWRFLKPIGNARAGLAATLLVFAATWALHSYQWFWLTGSWLVSGTDLLFWGVLGSLTCLELAFLLSTSQRPPGPFGLGLRIGATFLTVSLLWSLWSAPSLEDWQTTWRLALGQVSVLEAAALVAGFLFLAPVVGQLAPFWDRRSLAPAWSGGVLVVLVVLTALTPHLPPLAFLDSVRQGGLNQNEHRQLLLGYYGTLHQAERQQWMRWRQYAQKPRNWNAQVFLSPRGGVVPNFEGEYKGAPLRTNRWGMVDREHPLHSPRIRVAFVGASHLMGSGVAMEDRFTSLLAKQRPTVDVLNFGVGGLTLAQQPEVIRRKVAPFGPDQVVVVATAAAPFLLSAKRPQQATRDALSAIHAAITGLGARATLVYLPTLDLGTETHALEAWAREQGFEVIALPTLYAHTEWVNLAIAPWDRHPNALAHQRIAVALGPRLQFPGEKEALSQWTP